MRRISIIPVPRGMTAEEADAEISIMGRLVEYRWWRLRFRWPMLKWAAIENDEDMEEDE